MDSRASARTFGETVKRPIHCLRSWDCRVQITFLLISMGSVQAGWLAAIWLSDAATQWQKLPVLGVYSVACAILMVFLPTPKGERVTRLAWGLSQSMFLSMSLVVLGAAGVGALYINRQLGWPDESFAFNASRLVAEQGIEGFFTRYHRIPWLGDQHPPLVPLLYGGALHLFGVHLHIARAVSFAFGLATLSLTYLIGKKCYGEGTGLRAACLLLAMPFFFRIGATALLDMPATFFFTLSIYLFLRLLQASSASVAAGVGLSIGAGLLCRYTVVFVYPVLASCASLYYKIGNKIPYFGIIAFLSVVPISIWIFFAADNGVLAVQRPRLVEYTFYMLTSSDGLQRLLESLILRLPSGIGPALLPALTLGAFQLWRCRSQADLVMFSWVAGVFLPVMLMLPGPRYFFLAFPALAIVMARGVAPLITGIPRVISLALLYGIGNLYLFVDWYRAAPHLFVR